ncbi:MAG: [acyl-carrier-protein] S-malonyltransferase [Candidatus Firestonebacteria bacterium RIFOXYC2_FULL_39_67]|nr:MAG: [acyl-carrier-protein] S-malonyltransferase [Candidatus Firestonebacteria bacterium RIFOXYD2_FULL_39_29]OGF53759.1 MAG: [acyl-carrier-protein] S-malonyltransferase [Candidatus Firestonebacteria bacterium RIFOXYC2_FULL_39_67]
MKTAFLFPGQGSQSIGMGTEFFGKFAKAKSIFDSADSALGLKISDICFLGPDDVLKSTENAQPAILTTSIAILQEVLPFAKPDVVAGHSLGEYSALVATGVLDFKDAVKIVRKRGEFMKAASGGTMAAILMLPREKVDQLCKDASRVGLVAPANYNSPGQIVVSGTKEGVEEMCKLTKGAGGKAIPLAVSGPFHSTLMTSAQEKLAVELKNVNFNNPTTKIIANVTADYVKDGNTARELLVKQVVSSVLWEDTICRMLKDGIDLFVEVGPGKVLSGLVKKIKKEARVYNIDNTETLEKFKTEVANVTR